MCCFYLKIFLTKIVAISTQNTEIHSLKPIMFFGTFLTKIFTISISEYRNLFTRTIITLLFNIIAKSGQNSVHNIDPWSEVRPVVTNTIDLNCFTENSSATRTRKNANFFEPCQCSNIVLFREKTIYRPSSVFSFINFEKFRKISKNFEKFRKISKNFEKFRKISKNFEVPFA
jgi:hypothetical protein